MDAAIRTFFSSPRFAVVGASTDTSKYGYKLFSWYLSHNLDVTGVNPKKPTVLEKETVASLSDLEQPAATSVSIVTPPQVTLKSMKLAKELGMPAVFLQPGSFDEECLSFARDSGLVTIAGGGACVLVDGERGLDMAGKQWKL